MTIQNFINEANTFVEATPYFAYILGISMAVVAIVIILIVLYLDGRKSI